MGILKNLLDKVPDTEIPLTGKSDVKSKAPIKADATDSLKRNMYD
jgi:hypothetical protein